MGATNHDHNHGSKNIPPPSVEKSRFFDHDFPDDIFVRPYLVPLLKKVTARMDRVRSYVGEGRFNLMGFDEMLAFGRNIPQIGEFSPLEKSFLEELFHTDARTYGFFGERTATDLTSRIADRDVVKVPFTGHYLFRGKAENLYSQLRHDVGESVALISGIRSVVKQMHLFLRKTIVTQGNYSRASRQLAPPGHSFHGIGDFDVGKVGLGSLNFTDRFAQTDEFKRLMELGYVSIRYSEGNQLGVRYEPWHVKVVS